jgi:predicted acyl esterase
MKDGVRLAATLYMPEGAKPGEKFPAVLDYLPYRKDDSTAAGDYPRTLILLEEALWERASISGDSAPARETH